MVTVTLIDRLRMAFRPNVRCAQCDVELAGAIVEYGGVRFCSEDCRDNWRTETLAY